VIVVDSSVWVSRMVPQDAFHQVSRRWVANAVSSGETLIIPSLALAETAGAVARRTGRAALGRQSARWILRVPGIRVDPVDRAFALVASRLAADLMLRGPDAVFVALAYRFGVPLVTWDGEQASRASVLVTTLEPPIRA
jgi:predicted nucleic acid-binding protein